MEREEAGEQEAWGMVMVEEKEREVVWGEIVGEEGAGEVGTPGGEHRLFPSSPPHHPYIEHLRSPLQSHGAEHVCQPFGLSSEV